jgi:GDP-4-dehydro-6-deoxy-D-mannose reductase
MRCRVTSEDGKLPAIGMNMPSPARILITGFSGFAGRHLVAECAAHYPQAALFGLSDHSSLPSSAGGARVTAMQADITDAAQVRRVVAHARPDLVFHLAAQASVKSSWADPARTLAVNAGGTVHLLEALRNESLAPRVILVGSGEQYGQVRPEHNPIREDTPLWPVNPYAVAKTAQELIGYQYFVAYGLPVMRVRAFNHFGPYQADAFVVASFAHQIALIEAQQADPVLQVGNLDAERDFLPVGDVVRAYIAVAAHGMPGEVYNVGSGKGRSIRALLDQLLAQARVSISVHEDLTRLRPTDVPVLVADTSRLRTHTDWYPLEDFGRALASTLDYWRAAVHG